jgi:hypothetical protein
MTPLELLDAARDLIRTPRPGSAGLWPRAAALLGRQAVEEAVDDLWRRRAPGAEHASTTAQLLCLPAYAGDPQRARAAAPVWYSLSDACHQHLYDLAPTAGELEGWLDQARDLVWSVGPSDGSAQPQRT